MFAFGAYKKYDKKLQAHCLQLVKLFEI